MDSPSARVTDRRRPIKATEVWIVRVYSKVSVIAMSHARWKRTRAMVELCEPRRRYRDGTRVTPRERCRYAVTLSYPVRGDLYVTDVVTDRPLKEGSRVTLEYDSLEPRHNSLNHPRRERAAFRVALIFAALLLLPLLAIALVGL